MNNLPEHIRENHPLFQLGQMVITRGAAQGLNQEDVLAALSRYVQGDWGDIDSHDRHANDEATFFGSRILAAYKDSQGTKFWVITEANRSYTTVLLPEEY